jgi:hypothetical protein
VGRHRHARYSAIRRRDVSLVRQSEGPGEMRRTGEIDASRRCEGAEDA